MTTKNWANAWLNEGFAQFMEEAYEEATYGDKGAFERMEAQQQTIEADREARVPIVYDRWKRDPIEAFNSGQIYSTGASVLHMLRHQFGDALFWAAMHRYVVEHEYQSVVTEETIHQNLKPFFDQWVYGVGFPVFQVDYSYDPQTRHLTLLAQEVQPRDSLTGYFDVDVDVEANTGGHVVRDVVHIRHGVGEIVLALDGPPQSIRWNKGNWVLGLSDFPRPTRMLRYHLRHDDDVLGRLEAIDLLKTHTKESSVMQALRHAAATDTSWAVRRAAIVWLVAGAPDPSVRSVVLTVLQDRDTRVRQAAAEPLTKFPDSVTLSALTDALQRDSSLFVRGTALGAYITVAGDAGLPLTELVMATPSWRNVLRKPAIVVLVKMKSPAAQTLYHRYAQ